MDASTQKRNKTKVNGEQLYFFKHEFCSKLEACWAGYNCYDRCHDVVSSVKEEKLIKSCLILRLIMIGQYSQGAHAHVACAELNYEKEKPQC